MTFFVLEPIYFIFVILIALALTPLQALEPGRLRSASRLSSIVLAALGVFGLVATWAANHRLAMDCLGGTRFQVGSIGLVVGGVELIARYRDNPWRALSTWPAWLYMVINVAAGLLALRALQVVRPEWLYVKTPVRELQFYLVLTAGFGAVALFRSSLFKVRTSDGELAVGPSVVLDTLLQASDRAVDRILAAPRGKRVASIMETVSFAKAKTALPSYCFSLMQNVSQMEQQAVASQITKLGTADMNDKDRSLNMGLVLLNVVGDRVLQSAVGDLGDSIRAEPPPPDLDVPRIADVMRSVDVAKAAQSLPRLCFALRFDPTRKVDPAQRTAEWKVFEAQVASLWQPDETTQFEAFRLGLALAKLAGLPTLQLAVRQLGKQIKLAVTPDDGVNEAVLCAADLTRGVSFDKAALALPAYCIALSSAVSDDKKKTLADGIKALRDQAYPPRLKCLMMGLLLVDAVGLKVFKLAVEQLGAEILE